MGNPIAILIASRGRHSELAQHRWPASSPTLICDQSPAPFETDAAQVLHRPDLSGLPAARNVLLHASDTEWVVFLDDDAEPAADFLEQLEGCIASDPKVVAWGPVVETRGRWLRRAHRLLQLGTMRDPRRLTAGPADLPTRALFGCCFAVRRDVALHTGFDERRHGYALGEDLDFFLRLPGRKRFAQNLRCVHHESDAGRASPSERGHAKTAFLRWIARRHGGRNPATLLHLTLASVAALCAGTQAREYATVSGIYCGLTGQDPFVQKR
ncbi:MAG: glycosyltransferase [Planctomycetota bacterium]|jgi:GT2 family glycosyltransferase|nr:glycosyltransferase [Planctomycetota bacterium]